MAHTEAMLATTPTDFAFPDDALAEAIRSCLDCFQTCTACADSCLGEDDPRSLRTCIRLDLDCADICATTARVLSRQTGYDPAVTMSMLAACVEACRACASECTSHADMHEHCRICAEDCRRCEQACQHLIESTSRSR